MKSEWRQYSEWVDNFDNLVETQDRAKLDHVLPKELVRSVLENSNIVVFRAGEMLFSSRRDSSNESLPASKAFEMFGGSVIEDVFERGSVRVSY